MIEEAYEVVRDIVHERGPCCLAGWSFGGVLAHCLGSRLLDDGGMVRRLVLFDSYPMPASAVPDYSNPDDLWRDVALGAGLELPRHAAGLDAETIREIAASTGHVFGAFPLPQLGNLARLMANNSRLLPTAPLRRLNVPTTLFMAARATAGLDRSAVSATLWQPYFHDHVRIVSIDAEHHTMLTHGAVTQMRGHIACAGSVGAPAPNDPGRE
jgi:nonribosomal peptide synthetase DhbF